MGSRRRALFWLVLVVALVAFAECVAWGGYRAVRGKWFSWSSFQSARASVSGTAAQTGEEEQPLGGEPTERTESGRHVLHPYLGFVMDPRTRNGVSDHGFRGDLPNAPIAEAAPDRVVVGLFGGSVAAATSIRATGILREGVQQVRRFQGRDVVIQTVAWAGYKQPQQLLALAYFLSLGAHFDLVVNLDGFNEVALPPVDNLPAGVYPFYPRNWFGAVSNLRGRSALKVLARIEGIDTRRRAWAAACSRPPLAWSVVANLLWEVADARLVRQRAKEEADLRRHRDDRESVRPYAVSGPGFAVASEEDLYRSLARVWARSSVEMARLCAANGIEYLHFLQPNQYVPGSKPMGQAERSLAVVADQPYRVGVERGYPALQGEASFLRANGVHFVDLTEVFASTEEATYNDACCHLNRRGYEILGAAMVSAIQEHLEAGPGT